MNKPKYKKIGAVLRGDKGPFLVMGDTKAKNKQYQYDVELVVRDSDGKEVLKVKNPLISLFDPRTRPGITEEELERVPEKVRYEVCVKTPE